jgi:hypothetical protein
LRSEIDQKLIAGEKPSIVYRWAKRAFPVELAGISADIFYRHRNQHVKSIERSARKLSDHARIQREKVDLARAVLRDEIDPASYFGPAALAQDISRTEKRLDIAATEAFLDSEHNALASLSGVLVRTYELRGKLGGHVQEKTEISVTVALGAVHQRLDSLIGSPSGDRQMTSRGLLGLTLPAADPIPARRKPVEDFESLSNPGGENPLTIDMEAVGGQVADPDDDIPGDTPDDDSWMGRDESLGTRWR